jgi:hypothetical protein
VFRPANAVLLFAGQVSMTTKGDVPTFQAHREVCLVFRFYNHPQLLWCKPTLIAQCGIMPVEASREIPVGQRWLLGYKTEQACDAE